MLKQKLTKQEALNQIRREMPSDREERQIRLSNLVCMSASVQDALNSVLKPTTNNNPTKQKLASKPTNKEKTEK